MLVKCHTKTGNNIFIHLTLNNSGLIINVIYKYQASKFIHQKQYYDNINTKCKQYNGRLPEGNPSIELVAYSKI